MSQESFGVPIVNAGLLYKNGLAVSYSSATVANVAAGQCRDSTNTWDIVVPANGQTAPLTASLAFNGANGLDTGTVAASTFYYLYVIFDTTNLNLPATLFSTSATAPIMPSANGITYSAFRLIDQVLTDGSSNILPFHNSPGYGVIYKQYDTPIVVLTNGTATSATAIDLSGAVPLATFSRTTFTGTYVPHAAADTLTLKPTGLTSPSITMPGIVTAVSQPVNFVMLPVIASSKPEISYAVSSGTAPAAVNLLVLGYEFSV